MLRPRMRATVSFPARDTSLATSISATPACNFGIKPPANDFSFISSTYLCLSSRIHGPRELANSTRQSRHTLPSPSATYLGKLGQTIL